MPCVALSASSLRPCMSAWRSRAKGRALGAPRQGNALAVREVRLDRRNRRHGDQFHCGLSRVEIRLSNERRRQSGAAGTVSRFPRVMVSQRKPRRSLSTSVRDAYRLPASHHGELRRGFASIARAHRDHGSNRSRRWNTESGMTGNWPNSIRSASGTSCIHWQAAPNRCSYAGSASPILTPAVRFAIAASSRRGLPQRSTRMYPRLKFRVSRFASPKAREPGPRRGLE